MSHAICLVHYLGIFNNYAVSVRQRALEKQRRIIINLISNKDERRNVLRK